MNMKKTLMTIACAWLTAIAASAQTLSTGGQFMDLLLPMEGSVAATAADWGTAAGENTEPKYAGTWSGTLGRWKDNGIEDTERSYWGGNIIKGDDGKYHIYVSGWPESTAKGHMAWSSASRVYHVKSDNVWGPYTYVSDIGPGHNSEIYKTGDTYVIYHIEPLGIYKSNALGDSWESARFLYDQRGRSLIAGANTETSLSNCSFAKREDGSFVMIDRGGGIWVSRDGLTDPWHQLTDASVYLNAEIKNRGTLEDPVIWRDHLQYHMIVNDWQARYAYYYRSLDGLHWVKEAGKAYTGTDPFAKHQDGTVEAWHKYERPRVYQDAEGRAVRMCFAVIDCVKQSDLGSDTHSSKNINMPVTRQLLLEVQSLTETAATVLVRAEDGFNPKSDLNFSTLKFGLHDKVNYGGGFSYSSHAESGNDVIITFTGTDSGIADGEWAPKMLGQKTDGSIAFGYARMPAVDYRPAMLSAVTPLIAQDGTVQTVSVTNYGQSAAKTGTTVRVYSPDGNTLLAHGTTTALAAYATETFTLTKAATAAAGYKTIQVRFYDGETLLQTENIPLTAILEAQASLQSVIDEAEALYGDARMTTGKEAMLTAINAAKAVVGCYNAEAIETQKTALNAALNTFKYANASPTNGLSITVPNATMDDLATGWTLARKEADAAPGWKLNGKGGSYEGFDGNFMEYWVSQSGALGYANSARQTLTDMPAGRYRLRANIIATRQNSSDDVTGVTLFANSQTVTCATAKDGTPKEFMVELKLDAEGSIEIGLNIEASTTANWVAWDNVTLKYFGNAEGEIVEDEVEPLSFDAGKTFRIKSKATGFTRVYWQSPKYNASGDNNLHRTATAAEAAQLMIVGTATEGQFYLYDVLSHTFISPATGTSNGTAWTVSANQPVVTCITDCDGYYGISGTSGYFANAYSKDNSPYNVANYKTDAADSGNQWLIEEAEAEPVSVQGINPQAVYHIFHLNTSRNRYLAATPGDCDNLLTTNDNAQKGQFSLLPVGGQEGYYYIYNKEGYFVTPAAGNWTLVKGTPAAVRVTNNMENMATIGTTYLPFLLGEASQYANPQNVSGTELVKNYANKPQDKGNNWVLEPVSGAVASYNVPAQTLGYQTFSSPLPLDFSSTTTKAYIATSANDGKAVMAQVIKVPANTGLLLQGTDAETIPVLTTTDGPDDVSANLFVPGDGTAVSQETGYEKYVLGEDNGTVSFFRIGSTAATVAKGKAYLKATNGAGARLAIVFDGDLTGIETIDYSPLNIDHYAYDLQGHKWSMVNGQWSMKKGLYIINGKKTVIK